MRERRRIFAWVLLLLLFTPVSIAGPIDLGNGFQVELPDGWTREESSPLFSPRSGAAIDSTFHRSNTKIDALPYAVGETFRLPSRSPVVTRAEQQAFADQIASFYQTAITPPARSDRAGAWKSAKVTPAKLDATNRRFTFDAVLRYADRPGEYHVQVVGAFGPQDVRVLSIWSDDTTLAAHSRQLTALRDGFRLTDPSVIPMSLKDRAVRLARIVGGLIIVFVVGLQLYVFWRERRERAIADAGDA